MPLTRPRTAADNATPAGNGMMAEVLARLFHLTGNPDWRTRTSAVLSAFAGQPDQLAGMPTLLAAADLLEEATSVVIAGESAALLATALAAPDPAVVVLRAADTSTLPPDHPAFGKTAGPHAGRRLCLPAQRLRPADRRPRGVGPGVTHPAPTRHCEKRSDAAISCPVRFVHRIATPVPGDQHVRKGRPEGCRAPRDDRGRCAVIFTQGGSAGISAPGINAPGIKAQ